MMLKAISAEWGVDESIMEEKTSEELHEDKFLNIDSAKAENFLGLKPVYNLQETIAETVSWYKCFIESESEIKDYSIGQIKNYTDHAEKLNLSWT
jgi:CDP-glucose 4,6-dehydratase